MTMNVHIARLPLHSLLYIISCLGSVLAQSDDTGLFGDAYRTEAPKQAAHSEQVTQTESKTHWLDIGPSEDTNLPDLNAIGRIDFTPDGKHIFFRSRFSSMDTGYLWHVEDSQFTEYTQMGQKSIEQNRNRPFAKPPHPLRREVISYSGRIPGSDLNAVLNNGFSLSAPGKFTTVRYYTTDWNVQPGADSVSLSIGMPIAYSPNFVLQYFPDPNYGRNGLLTYGIVNLTELTKRALPIQYQTRPFEYCVGQTGMSVACFFARGIEIHTFDGPTQIRKVQFAYPAERPRIASKSFMNGDKWLVCILQQPGQPGIKIWVIDVQTGQLVQTIDAPDGQPVDANFSASGTRLVFRTTLGVAFYEVKAGELSLLTGAVADSDLALVKASTVYQLSHGGTAIAFVQVFSDRTTDRVGLLDWP